MFSSFQAVARQCRCFNLYPLRGTKKRRFNCSSNVADKETSFLFTPSDPPDALLLEVDNPPPDSVYSLFIMYNGVNKNERLEQKGH